MDQKLLLKFPASDYTYIDVNFYTYNNNIIIVNDEDDNNEEENKNINSVFFIFKKMNWFISHEMRRRSIKLDPYWNPKKKTICDTHIYKKNVIDLSLRALITEKDKLIVLNEDKKKLIDINVLFFAVDKYLEQDYDDNAIMEFDLDKFSVDLHKYYKYQYMRRNAINQQNSFLLPVGQEPIVPAPVILESLITRFPGMTIDQILNMDMGLLKLFELINTQKDVADFESAHINDEIGKK